MLHINISLIHAIQYIIGIGIEMRNGESKAIQQCVELYA